MKPFLIALAAVTAFDALAWSGVGREATFRWVRHVVYVIQSQDWQF